MNFDAKRVEDSISRSLGVIAIRAEIANAEAEMQQAILAVRDMPKSLQQQLLERLEKRLVSLDEREQVLVAQARKTAEAELRRERVESLRIEAAPLLERASKCLDIIRTSLAQVAAIEAEARANGGRVMTDAFDKSSVDYFIPHLKLDSIRGTWSLTR